MQEVRLPSLGLEDAREKETATPSSILAWEISWAEESGEPQSLGSQKSWTRLSNRTTVLRLTALEEPSWLCSLIEGEPTGSTEALEEVLCFASENWSTERLGYLPKSHSSN